MFSRTTAWITLGLWALSPGASAVKLGGYPKDMFDKSMSFLDQLYDDSVGYLYWFYYPLAAGQHETRSTIWYVPGLLNRQRGDDVEQAIRILRNVIGDQEKNVEAQWYGDYTVYPEQPTVNSSAYPPSIYNSWDPNWRGFIGTTLMVVYEEFRHLLPGDVQELILESMYNNTVGDSYRVGGVDDDNLYPSYSNPAYMRAVASGWTGRKLQDENMTAAGEMYANEVLELFNMNNTLSEFNSPTYAGITIYALTLWAKYMPSDSVMGREGQRVLGEVWDLLASMYNPNLRNLAGPWDRTYGYDMNKYVGILSVYLWSMIGEEAAFGGYKESPFFRAHADDMEIAPMVAILAPFHNSLVPNSTIQKLASCSGETLISRKAYAPPYDMEPRNITTWVSPNLTIGGESFNQRNLGGAREDRSSWNPGVIQWKRRDDSVGWFNVYPSETAMTIEVAPNSINFTYPNGNASSVFSFIVASNPLGGKRDITSIQDIEDLDIEVSGTVDVGSPSISFCGLVGGTCNIIHGFEFWNITWSMPSNTTDVPSINLKVNLS
ncbi:hypothetical protein DPSP01_013552 [Paraphaeosphaeria sporulosa]|uniref:Linalool dehydratase/isomerase domain-containing protein n=1 Tax=Paraphaeosphaeria sporulosa TaxID=1460663 RepID=A0A177C175_9PLEO|nr:uncharacterized protein CC84DRAFT_1230080 [Paraphaeosphaeria sporulosa]OAG01245.1 hypothetical protein CC84DRAFT_1230080 [Paraphaeosphaeria sporulosa]